MTKARSSSRLLVPALFVGALALAIASIIVAIVNGAWDVERAAIVVANLAFITTGSVVANKVPSNPIGWIFIGVGFLMATENLGRNYIDVDPGEVLPPGSLVLGFVVSKIFIFYLLLFSVIFLLFPTGKLPSPRWKRLLILSIANTAVCLPLWYLLPGPLDDEPPLSKIPNPYAVDLGPAHNLVYLASILLILTLLGAVIAMVVRFRQSHGIERLQLKWFATGASVFGVALVFAGLAWAQVHPWLTAANAFLSSSIALVPIMAGLAIMRYRLFDIDVIVNRALVYGASTAGIIAIYIGVVFVFQQALEPVTRDSDVAVAASTLLAAALFRPLRDRVQDFVDRRFYRNKYSSEQTMSAFATRLRNQVELDSVSRDLLDVVQVTVQPAHASLWLKADSP